MIAGDATTSCVCDASVVLALLLPDEHWAAQAELKWLGVSGRLVAPAVWPTELLNGLRTAIRKDRVASAAVPTALEAASRLNVGVQNPASSRDWLKLHRHAQSTGLTPYDASYHLLALDLQVPLATQDKQLRAAASAAGIALLGD